MGLEDTQLGHEAISPTARLASRIRYETFSCIPTLVAVR